jgi:mycothiol maleylpyruvate isomerase-like protein
MTGVHTSVENLAIVWDSVDRPCSDLPGSEWELPTGCPGWSVKDHLSHLVGFESRAIGRAGPVTVEVTSGRGRPTADPADAAVTLARQLMCS